MELFTMSSCLTMKEWHEFKLVTKETARLKNKTSFFFFVCSFDFFFNEQSR